MQSTSSKAPAPIRVPAPRHGLHTPKALGTAEKWGSGPRRAWTTVHNKPPDQCTSGAARAGTVLRVRASAESAAGLVLRGLGAVRERFRRENPMPKPREASLLSRARGQRRRRQFRLLGHSVVSLSVSPIPRAKPGLPCPIKFRARLPLPDGRVNSGYVLSAYSCPGFAVAVHRYSARAEKPGPAQGRRIATVTQRTGSEDALVSRAPCGRGAPGVRCYRARVTPSNKRALPKTIQGG